MQNAYILFVNICIAMTTRALTNRAHSQSMKLKKFAMLPNYERFTVACCRQFIVWISSNFSHNRTNFHVAMFSMTNAYIISHENRARWWRTTEKKLVVRVWHTWHFWICKHLLLRFAYESTEHFHIHLILMQMRWQQTMQPSLPLTFDFTSSSKWRKWRWQLHRRRIFFKRTWLKLHFTFNNGIGIEDVTLKCKLIVFMNVSY